ncbi:hypothetical protein POM88_015228 [Heracleum sosnowskyi]|uniref:Uncharacterized protein n=1 Tax=Heracleum sosnowskyi TaxID=360622 RepID=A0AAD8IJT6_9APIA|nr:hypothetical protein POM88_015228 [Heracleum sosnowskyi]
MNPIPCHGTDDALVLCVQLPLQTWPALFNYSTSNVYTGQLNYLLCSGTDRLQGIQGSHQVLQQLPRKRSNFAIVILYFFCNITLKEQLPVIFSEVEDGASSSDSLFVQAKDQNQNGRKHACPGHHSCKRHF